LNLFLGFLERVAAIVRRHVYITMEVVIMSILAWIVVGLIAGWLASVVMKGGGSGLLGDLVLGIVGALVGGFLASSVFKIADPLSGINLVTVLVAFVGAVIVVAIVRALSGRRMTV
jgi:uncharacterized membrane protein YeaQ/YmgE (transglycosylase-associated protein family)